MNAALVHNMSTEISTDIAPHSRLVFENAGQVSNQATVASVKAFKIPRQGHQAAARLPGTLDEVLHLLDNDHPALAAFLSRRAINGRNLGSGRRQPPRRRRRRVTRKGRSAAEEAHQRLDTVAAVAFPASTPRLRVQLQRRAPELRAPVFILVPCEAHQPR